MANGTEEIGKVTEATSFVDLVMGGANHSPEAEAKAGSEAIPGTQEEPAAPEEFGEKEESPFADDSAKDAENKPAEAKPAEPKPAEQAAPEENSARLKQEVETLSKRLRDTQSAMHKATNDRAALQKELEELKAKKENGDDWFKEEDQERAAKIEADLKKSDSETVDLEKTAQEIERKAAEAIWNEAEAKAKAEHADFDEVVYEKFAPLLDAKTGNANVRQLWEAEKDKSPASAYKFARKLLDIQELSADPEAYKAKIRKEIEQEQNKKTPAPSAPLGKAGLDIMPSADIPLTTGEPARGFVDSVFK